MQPFGVYDVVQIFLWFENFESSLILFSFVSDSLQKQETKENKNQTGFKICKPKKHLNLTCTIISGDT